MRQRIIRIGKLIKDNTLAFVAQFFCRVTRQLHATGLGGQHQLRTVSTHGLYTLYTLTFRHNQNHAVTAYGCRHRQRNAGIAAGRFDQCVTRLDLAALLGSDYHGQCRPVLHRSGGIVAFQLGQQDIAGIAGNAFEPYQRGVAHIMFDGVIHLACL